MYIIAHLLAAGIDMYKFGFPFSAAAIALAFGNSARAIGLDDLATVFRPEFKLRIFVVICTERLRL